MKALFFTLLTCFLPFLGYNQSAPLTKIWDKTFGGTGEDILGFNNIIQTSDSGFIIGGSSSSNQGGDKSENNKGGLDYWVVRIDAHGNKIWDRTIGGNQNDELLSLIETSNGNYLLVGYSLSDKSGDKSEDKKGVFQSGWIVKVDQQGNKLWDKTYGGDDTDFLGIVSSTSDGSFLIGGYSYSNQSGDKSEPNRGRADYWVVKIDSNGNKLWDRTFGGNSDDFLYSIASSPDGGYLLAGHSSSGKTGDKSENSKGEFDYWIIKIDSSGNKLWDKTFGGNQNEELSSVIRTSDGNYILGGNSVSNKSGDKSEDSKGGGDYWIIKIDIQGNKIWDKTYGGNRGDNFERLVFDFNQNLLLCGQSNSPQSGDKSEDSKGGRDYWIIKIDIQGNKIWDKTYGGENEERFFNMIPTATNGYLLAGQSNSPESGDKSENSKGGTDWWIIKIQERDSCNVNLNLIASDILCAGTSTGSIKTQVTNGTLPFEFSLNELGFQADSVFSGLSAGVHTVKVRDASGCTKTEQVTLKEPRPLRFLVFTQRKVTCPTCEDGVIVAQGIGGMPPYTFSANGKPFTNNVLRGLPKGNYEVELKDRNGCSLTRSIQVK